MTDGVRKFLKNAIFTFSSNAASFIINAIIVLVIPKIIGVSEYGYYQLYVLLGTYVTCFHFGWCDGIYLRYVGQDYKDLDKKVLSSQFKGLFTMNTVTTIVLLLGIYSFVESKDKIWIYSIAALAVFVVTPKIYTSVVMQMTNRMKEYSQIILIEKVTYAVVLTALLMFGIRDYRILILSDLVGKILALMVGVYFCKDIVFCKERLCNKLAFKKETKANIFVGIFLLISNLASVLITGIVQFFIEFKWDISTFSRVSLTFNMSKMLMVVITAMSVVLVPMLKNMNEATMSYMYKRIRALLMLVLGAMLIFYYPLKILLSFWLPQYTLSLQYMALLFPMCLFESKTQLLANTYLKALREEKKLCLVNMISVGLSAVVSYVIIFIFENLNASILIIPYLLAFRCILLEIYIGKRLNIHVIKDAIIEVLLATVFIGLSWFINSPLSMLIYTICYLIYILYIRKELKRAIQTLLPSMKLRKSK